MPNRIEMMRCRSFATPICALLVCASAATRVFAAPSLEPGAALEQEGIGYAHELQRRGELELAQHGFERALVKIRGRDPGGAHEADVLRALGDVAAERHDLAAAERYTWDALALYEKLKPGANDVAAMRSALGNIYRRRGDLVMARKLIEQALLTYRAAEPAGEPTLIALTNLAEIAAEQNDRAAARKYLMESRAILDASGLHDAEYGARMLDIGRAEIGLNDLGAAERHLTDALRALERSGTQRLQVATALTSLGRLHAQSADLTTARAELLRAIDIAAPLAPGTQFYAEPYYRLAMLERKAGNGRLAAQMYARSLDALESERTMMGGSENSRVAFSESVAAYYLDYVDLLVALGRFDDAFDVSERYRARELLDALLTKREVAQSHLPPQLALEYERVLYRYDRAFEEVHNLGQRFAARDSYERAFQNLEIAFTERSAFIGRMLSANSRPRSGLPRPSTAAELRRLLPHNTALLSYVTTRTRVHLFIVGVPAATPAGRASIAHRVVSQDPARLGADVDALMVQLRAHADTEDGEEGLNERLGALHARLISPAIIFVRDKQRLVIVPDRNLYRVPWAALAPRSSRPGYLLEDFRIMVAPSATYHVQARPDPSRGAETPLVLALAGPESSPGMPRAPGTVTAMNAEVESIKTIFGTSASILTGAQATEEAAKRVAPQAQILHFAAHAVADESSPLESYIALAGRSRAGTENGYLQAWEVMQQMRLHARLVVLSACDTAGGRESAGEGMLGLVHAFHYAGAPQVMASLWPVSDQATAALMKSFYERIAAGESPDAALRTAQMDLLHGEERSWLMRFLSPETVEPRRVWQHPYYWAGFQLSGADVPH